MAGATMAESAATGALKPVEGLLNALLGDEYNLVEGSRSDTVCIKSELEPMHSLLLRMSEVEDLDAPCKQLMMEVRELSYDLEDAIDGFIQKTETSLFQDLKIKVKDVSERCRQRLQTGEAITNCSKLTADPRARFRHKNVSELVGMDGPKDELTKLLVAEEGALAQQLKIVCIVGFAGTGKTTLAYLVFHTIEEQFDCRAFVSVSRCPNVMEILRTILTEVTNVPCSGTEAATEQHLIDDISNFLTDKRYLVIIDDIWHLEEWEIIRKSLPKNNLGSRIITTTRIDAIAEKCRTDNDAFVYKIRALDSDATTMLSRMVIMKSAPQGIRTLEGEIMESGTRTPKEIVMKSVPQAMVKYLPRGKQCYDIDILDMCHGVPLAVICISSAVAGELAPLKVFRTPEEDREVRRRIQDGFFNFPCLKPFTESICLGYHDLPLHLRTCLLYLSIYPNNHKIERDHLVRKWIAEGFVYEEEAAVGYIDELVFRSLIQSEGGIVYPMHSLMLSVLRCKSQEENFVTCVDGSAWQTCVDGSDNSSLCTRRIRRLALQYHQDSVYFSGKDLFHTRSLVVFGDAKIVTFKRFERLRVLDLEYSYGIEDALLVDICGLLWLRYLGLKGTPISQLPREIRRLEHLEMLDVSKTSIKELPREIGRLEHLKTLDVRNTGVGQLPMEMGRLEHLDTPNVSTTGVGQLPMEILEHLDTRNVSTTSAEEPPRELGQLSKSVLVPEGVCKILIKFPKGVCKILISIVSDDGQADTKKNDNLMSSLEECRQLQSLEIHGDFSLSTIEKSLPYTLLKVKGKLTVATRYLDVPVAIADVSFLGGLDIRVCKLEDKDLKVLRELPSLQSLVLRFEFFPRKPISIISEGFKSLESFCVDCRMPRVTFKQGAMQKLKHLEFKFYAGRARGDRVGITHLRSLEKVTFRCSPWYESSSLSISATIDVVRKEASEHPNRISLCINGKEEIFPENKSAQICEDNNVGSSSGTSGIESSRLKQQASLLIRARSKLNSSSREIEAQ